MKRLASTFSASILILIALTNGCTKSENPVNSAPTEITLTRKLPKETTAFFAFNFQHEGLKSLLSNPSYGKYIEGVVEAPAKNQMLKGSYETYVKVSEALGVFVKRPDQLSFSDALIFGAPLGENKWGFAAFYRSIPGKDARELVAKAKSIVSEKGNKVTEVKEDTYSGFSLRPFDEMSPDDPMRVYEALPGFKEVFIVASEAMLAISSDRSLVARAFSSNEEDSKVILESAEFKEAMAQLPNRGSTEAGHGYFDLSVFRKQVEDPIPVPLKAAAFNMTMSKGGEGFVGNVVITSQELDGKSAQLAKSLEGLGSNQTLQSLPSSTALAIGIDGAFVRGVVNMAAESNPDPMFGLVKDTLSNITTFRLGLTIPQSGAMYPDLFIVAKSNDPAALKGSLKAQLAMLPTQPGMEWKTKEDAGLTIEYLPTPMGIGAYYAATGDSVIATSSEASLKAIASGNGLSEPGVVADVNASLKDPAGAIFINYPNFVKLMENLTTMAQMFAPGQDVFGAMSQIDYLKHMGEIVITTKYDPKVLRISMGQRLSK